MCGQGGFPGETSFPWRMRNMWSGQGPVSSLNYLAILSLEFGPQGMTPQSLYPGWRRVEGRGIGGWETPISCFI